MVGCLGAAILLADFGPLALGADWLTGWLEAVDVQPDQLMEVLQCLQGCFGLEAVIAHQPSHHGPVLLFHVRLVVLLVGPGAGEGGPCPWQ